jgi:chromosome segregation ATPase
MMTSELKAMAERLGELAHQCDEVERDNEDLRWRLETREREIRLLNVDVIKLTRLAVKLNMDGM